MKSALSGASIVLGLFMAFAASPAHAEPTDADIRRVMKEEIGKLALNCVTRKNTAGYSTDGYVNFRSFLDNILSTSATDRVNGKIIFQIKAIPGQETNMVINLSPDQQQIAGFRVTSEKIVKSRKRTGTLIDPQYEDVETRESTFELVCLARPRSA